MNKVVRFFMEGQKLIHDWELSETNLQRLSQRKFEVAVLPVGAIEPHNRHLPEGQDWLHTTHVARESCRRAWQQCQSIICLPAIPYGVDCNLLDFPLTIHVSQATLDAMVRDIVASLRHHQIQKILLINGHGGNDFKPLVRQLQCELDVHLFLCDWWRVAADHYSGIFEMPDDHAGEFETSIALALFPQLVELANAGPGLTRPFRFEALNKGWVQASRRFSRLNDHCAAGDPTKASADKGKKYLDLVIQRISDFLVEMATSPLDDFFPQQP
ncbi:MAG: creatininase family protein [candidate division KSB1 bacterium]|nr:creatininase family protein [candidate division KSB1 bacterium]